jgi:hypothetical protein
MVNGSVLNRPSFHPLRPAGEEESWPVAEMVGVMSKRSIFVMLSLHLLTLTLFEPVWYLRQRRHLNIFRSSRKVADEPWVLLILIGLIMALALGIYLVCFAKFTSSFMYLTKVEIKLLVGFFYALVATRYILGAALAGWVRRIWLDHFGQTGQSLPPPSLTYTLLFRMFYLQFWWNRHEKYIDPAKIT